MTQRILKLAILAWILFISATGDAQTIDPKLDTSIASLRNINIEGLSDEQREDKAKQIDAAWKFLIAAGKPAAQQLKKEIEKVDGAKDKDDFFKLNATVLLWNIGKASEAEYIAQVSTSTPIQAQYTYVFYTAFEAAQTQDPKVLPMLRAVLKDDKGSIYVGADAMNVAWPLSHEFIWGAYGPAALPVLLEILDKSSDEIEVKSAIKLLAQAQYLPALPKIRHRVSDPRDEVRRNAIHGLGLFGHPADYERLIAGLKSTDPKELFSYAFALYEFEDERAVKHLIPLLETKDEQLMVETSLALLHLLTPESLHAVKKALAKSETSGMVEFLNRRIKMREDKLPKNFAKLTPDQQRLALANVRNADLLPKPTETAFTNRQLLDALNVWRTKGRIYNSGSAWVGQGRVIAVAEPENIDLILQAKAAFYRRLSDECLYEVRNLDKSVKYIGRSRYRKGIGVVTQAESK